MNKKGLFATKPIQDYQEEASSKQLIRALGIPALIAFGIGGIIGTGIFVLTGLAAAQHAGPAIAISFITWGGYMAMVFLRVTAGWRGRKAAIMVIVVVGLSAVTWFAHARYGVLMLKP